MKKILLSRGGACRDGTGALKGYYRIVITFRFIQIVVQARLVTTGWLVVLSLAAL